MEIVAPVEMKEMLTRSVSEMRANAFKAELPIHLTVFGREGLWRPVKGGHNLASGDIERFSSLKSANFIVLYNEESDEWLKIVPPGARLNISLTNRLRKSVPIGKAALEISGLPEISGQIQEGVVLVAGKEVYGFTSPHIGPSLGFCHKRLLGSALGKDLPEDAAGFIADAFSVAFNQALRLYLETGSWCDDPNPDNVLLNFKDGLIRVVLIDFSNDVYRKNNYFGDNSPEADRRRMENIKILYKHFVDQFRNLGIDHPSSPEDFVRKEIADRMIRRVENLSGSTNNISK